uniref:KRAB domain-containing protein n=1 Tax=Laticauda laticaudata TaxID=8630 RepID=A0A8C5ST58_LATLA
MAVQVLHKHLQCWSTHNFWRQIIPLINCSDCWEISLYFTITSPLEGLVSFKEVAVYFSEEEWSQLDPDQKVLHSEVMLENRRNVVSLGKSFLVPNQEVQKERL